MASVEKLDPEYWGSETCRVIDGLTFETVAKEMDHVSRDGVGCHDENGRQAPRCDSDEPEARA